jgi:hypothetical protein
MSTSASAPNVPDAEGGASVPQRCLNCQTVLQGAYCHCCGQSASVRHMSFRRVVIGLMQGLVDLDSKTLRTVRHLFYQPGAMTRAYIRGRRASYLDPLRYYMLVVAVSIGLAALLGIMDITRAGANQGDVFLSGSFVAFQVGLLYALFMLPLAVAQWYLHRAGLWTIAEHYVFLLYLLAQSILVLVLLDGALFILTSSELKGQAEGATGLGVLVTHIVWAGPRFYAEAVWHVIWKTAVALFLSLLGTAFVSLLGIGGYHLARLLLFA